MTASCDLGRMAVGATVTATLVVDTDPSLTTISNIAFAGSGGLDISTFDNEDGLEVALQPVADLSVTKTGPATVSSAAAVEYVIGYRNDGPSTATDVVVTDTLPTGLTPRPVTGCTISGRPCPCAVGRPAPGATGSITITADVDPALALGTVLTDVATVSQPGRRPGPATDNTGEAHHGPGTQRRRRHRHRRPGRGHAGRRRQLHRRVTNNGPQLAPAWWSPTASRRTSCRWCPRAPVTGWPSRR